MQFYIFNTFKLNLDIGVSFHSDLNVIQMQIDYSNNRLTLANNRGHSVSPCTTMYALGLITCSIMAVILHFTIFKSQSSQN